ncbi:MAG TPA: ATP-binding protein [Acidobacteriota bacterium]|nr:ATP-binding protein [Acidobacteriota bacterium]
MSDDQLQQKVQELKGIRAVGDLPEEELTWLAKHLTEVRIAAGECVGHEGDPADSFYVFLEGEIHLRRESDPADTRVLMAKAGEFGGKLPFSRLTQWPGTGRAVGQVRLLKGSVEIFPEMIHDHPLIVERLVAVMSDRIRFFTREDQQRDRMAALGKLSAGLAHELNNPAAAAKRGALALGEAQEALREANSRLDVLNLTIEQRKCISHFERQALQHFQAHVSLDSLAQSEQEDQITSWLESHQVRDGWKLAPVLAEISLDDSWLQDLKNHVGDEALSDALARIVSQVLARRLTKEVEASAGRISELVKAIKEYSYMDQAPIQEIDIHEGLETTLVMLRYKLKHGIEVERIFDKSLPRISAFGSELNQVWTNLIDNASDAMKEGGKLTIRTTANSDVVLVEITDTGKGIPAEIQPKIFEPFFTTKKMGEGTGLGLDTVYRIIRKHHGSIRVDSVPGNTRFQIRLPIKQPSV